MTIWNLFGFVLGVGIVFLIEIAYLKIKTVIQRRKWRKQ